MKTKAKTLTLIDHSFYQVSSARTAKTLSIESRLPRLGYQMRVDLAKLGEFDLQDYHGRTVKGNIREAWLQETWHNGKLVWAVMVCWN